MRVRSVGKEFCILWRGGGSRKTSTPNQESVATSDGETRRGKRSRTTWHAYQGFGFSVIATRMTHVGGGNAILSCTSFRRIFRVILMTVDNRLRSNGIPSAINDRFWLTRRDGFCFVIIVVIIFFFFFLFLFVATQHNCGGIHRDTNAPKTYHRTLLYNCSRLRYRGYWFARAHNITHGGGDVDNETFVCDANKSAISIDGFARVEKREHQTYYVAIRFDSAPVPAQTLTRFIKNPDSDEPLFFANNIIKRVRTNCTHDYCIRDRNCWVFPVERLNQKVPSLNSRCKRWILDIIGCLLIFFPTNVCSIELKMQNDNLWNSAAVRITFAL